MPRKQKKIPAGAPQAPLLLPWAASGGGGWGNLHFSPLFGEISEIK